jgi:hypothetical protein
MESIRFKAEPVEPDFTKAVDFWSQRDGLCRWPLVHTPILDARFCGAPVLCKGGRILQGTLPDGLSSARTKKARGVSNVAPIRAG